MLLSLSPCADQGGSGSFGLSGLAAASKTQRSPRWAPVHAIPILPTCHDLLSCPVLRLALRSDLRAIQGLPEAEKLRRSSTLHPHTCWTPSSRGVQFQDSLLLGLPSSSRLTLHSRSPSAIIWCTCLNWAWPISLTGFMLVYATVLRTVSDVCLSHMQTSDSRRLGLLSTNVCTQFKLKCRPRSKSRSATMSCGFDCSHCSDSHLQHDKACPLLFDRCACNP